MQSSTGVFCTGIGEINFLLGAICSASTQKMVAKRHKGGKAAGISSPVARAGGMEPNFVTLSAHLNPC